MTPVFSLLVIVMRMRVTRARSRLHLLTSVRE
jgi:hypothetical protein